jgi:hypothetical protein
MTQKNQKLLLNKKIVHPTDLSVYVAKPMFKDNTIPYITTDRLRAWRFSSKKEAKKWAGFYGSCQIDCYWVGPKGI